jgi:hypothetical protein
MAHRKKENIGRKLRRRSYGKTSVRIVGDAEMIQSGYLQNTSHPCHCYFNLPFMHLYLLW